MASASWLLIVVVVLMAAACTGLPLPSYYYCSLASAIATP
jgi:hypothetical protein